MSGKISVGGTCILLMARTDPYRKSPEVIKVFPLLIPKIKFVIVSVG